MSDEILSPDTQPAGGSNDASQEQQEQQAGASDNQQDSTGGQNGTDGAGEGSGQPGQEEGLLTPPCDYEGLVEAITEKGDAFEAEIGKAIAIFKAIREALLPYRMRCTMEMRKVIDAIGNLPEDEDETVLPTSSYKCKSCK